MENDEVRDPRRVRRMFGSIAGRYDLLNHLLSGNLDRRWRRAAVAQFARDPPARVLDLCGGTGDLAVAAAAVGAKTVICCDFCHPMLVLAGQKFERAGGSSGLVRVEADALRLPFRDGGFDAVTLGFGLRNLAGMDAGLREIRRVLRPGGRLVVLEFSTPTVPVFGRIYRAYLRNVLPRVGDALSGRGGAYAYLAATVSGFPDARTLASRILASGFVSCRYETLTWGIVAVHTALK